jgi:hypothetical protein
MGIGEAVQSGYQGVVVLAVRTLETGRDGADAAARYERSFSRPFISLDAKSERAGSDTTD